MNAMLLTATLLSLAQQCAPNVAPHTMATLIAAESSGNPYAIGVVGMQLIQQPTNAAEAMETAKALLSQGANISVGLGQVNKGNFEGLGLTLEQAFEPCPNITASGKILTSCYERASSKMGEGQEALKAAFSCYYSNNFTRGFVKESESRPSYVMHIANNSEKLKSVPAIQFKPSDVKEIAQSQKNSSPTTAPGKALEEFSKTQASSESAEIQPPKQAADTNDPLSWDVFGEFKK